MARIVALTQPISHGPSSMPGRPGSLGAALRRVRDRQGLSLPTVASMLNVPAEQLRRIEQGSLASGPAVERVARWLRVPVPSGRHR